MHDGVIPGAFAANTLIHTPNGESPNADMKSRNKRNAPNRRQGRTSFADWLRHRQSAEEEETFVDNDERAPFPLPGRDEELEDEDLEDEMGADESECCPDCEEEEEEDPEEFDDYDNEKDLEFEDEDERAPFPLPGRNDDDDETAIPTGRFSDFFRMDQGGENSQKKTCQKKRKKAMPQAVSSQDRLLEPLVVWVLMCLKLKERVS